MTQGSLFTKFIQHTIHTSKNKWKEMVSRIVTPIAGLCSQVMHSMTVIVESNWIIAKQIVQYAESTSQIVDSLLTHCLKQQNVQDSCKLLQTNKQPSPRRSPFFSRLVTRQHLDSKNRQLKYYKFIL